ncbi:hypothetical protein M427DRAFT_26790 [Gonapodya prolifera JEL478]|uniref:Rrp15p-domain-containing protein n=1 Tax=Gonapodya prolifera (strain JEL478) TaxID=1344416 RepID=A0A139AZI9_GONPJ|nr:hypothetical protein M427DRAFT_26790 [Gonapodya prolifera JEL478]|eukprot:KXS22151.1 hypothetical protein M427DRAFT_26790 [Gonapodya prolifera JEL478]
MQTHSPPGSDSESQDDFANTPRHLKKKKKKAHSTSNPADVALAISSILNTNSSRSKKQHTILSSVPLLEQKLDKAKVEAKARRAIAAQRKQLRLVGRVTDVQEGGDREKALRRIATKGVVKLFNAIRTAQFSAGQAGQGSDGKQAAKAVEGAKEQAPITRAAFLALLNPTSQPASTSSRTGSSSTTAAAKSEFKQEERWSVLRDGKEARLGDWEKGDDSGEEGEDEELY